MRESEMLKDVVKEQIKDNEKYQALLEKKQKDKK